MNFDINFLKQAVLRSPLDAPGLEPLTSVLNGFHAQQAVETEAAYQHCVDDATAPHQQRLDAEQSLEAIRIARSNE